MSRPRLDGTVVLVDTSVLLNVLRVPNMSGERTVVLDRLHDHIHHGDQLLLPAATVVETGNHIAQNGNGSQRRECAGEFVEVVRQAAEQSLPWGLVDLPPRSDLIDWLAGFPDSAMRGVGFGDFTIIKAWEDACNRFPGWCVAIWSLDQDLDGYNRPPLV